MRYKKYPHYAKVLISKTKEVGLFPELNIPKTTARYWIKSKYHLGNTNNIDENLEIQKLKLIIRKYKEENRELKNRMFLTKNIQNLCNLSLKNKHIQDYAIRKKLVDLIYFHKKRTSLRVLLNDQSISFSRFKRWNKEINNYIKVHNNPNKYYQSSSRSITYKEFQVIKKYYTNPKLFHLPLHALCSLAKRNGDLYSSSTTWRKYAKQYKFKGPNLKHKYTKRYPIGIERSYPNHLWHIDTSEIKVRNKKYFLQVIIDNKSRYVLNWQIMDQWNGYNTTSLIKKSVNMYEKPFEIMMDAGSENLNKHVQHFLKDNNIKALVAKYNTHFSNSKIEIFFRTLKSNYLSKIKIYSKIDLHKHIKFYINQYNNVIPHSYLNERTPEEVYFGMPKEFYIELFKYELNQAIKARIENYSHRDIRR